MKRKSLGWYRHVTRMTKERVTEKMYERNGHVRRMTEERVTEKVYERNTSGVAGRGITFRVMGGLK